MKHGILETLTGAVILAVAIGYFLFMWLQVDPPQTDGSYGLQARFLNVGGLQNGADVRIRGIKIGTVTGVGLDTETFEATVTMRLDGKIKLPEDTLAAIGSNGLTGDKYLRLKPGKVKKVLVGGDTFGKVEDYKSLEDQVSRIIFLAASPDDEK